MVTIETPAEQPEPGIRRGQGQGTRRQPSGTRLLNWFCVYERQGATIPCAEGNGPARRARKGSS